MRIWQGAPIAITASVLVAFAACDADPNGPPLVGGPSGDAAVTSTDPTCAAKEITALDPATLPSCCTTGAAHCVPKDNVAPGLRRQFAECGGGFCEPDPLIKDPKLVLKTCVSLNAAPGACVSVCVPQVQQYLSILPQDACGADERCAPCINTIRMV